MLRIRLLRVVVPNRSADGRGNRLAASHPSRYGPKARWRKAAI